MANVKVGVVEDEMLIAHGIVQALTALGYESTEPAISYTEALGMIVDERPDILLLDIQLKGHKDGIDLARRVKEEFNIPFIFLTANADAGTVARAKSVNPHAYLVKPFNNDDLYAAIEICLHNFSTAPTATGAPGKQDYIINDSLFIRFGAKYYKIRIDEILYIESSDVYINVHTANNKFLVRNGLQHFLDQNSASQFLRVHKTYAVNVNHITSVSAEIIVVNNVEIPIGRAYKDEVISFLRLE